MGKGGAITDPSDIFSDSRSEIQHPHPSEYSQHVFRNVHFLFLIALIEEKYFLFFKMTNVLVERSQ